MRAPSSNDFSVGVVATTIAAAVLFFGIFVGMCVSIAAGKPANPTPFYGIVGAVSSLIVSVVLSGAASYLILNRKG